MAIKNGTPTSPVGNEEELDVTSSAATSTAEDDNVPGSSPAEGDDNDTMADAIRSAVGEPDDADSVEDAAKPVEEGDAETDEKSVEDDPEKSETDTKTDTEEEDDQGEDIAEGQKVPYNRFKKVIDQRNSLKEQVQSKAQEADTYRQGHEQFKAITDYMQQHELSTSDVAEALQIAGLMSTNPAEAMKLLAPKVQMLQQYTGEILPTDLQQQVDTGELSPQAAQEIVRTRNENARLNRQNQKRDQQQSQQEQSQQIAQVRKAMATAADTTQAQLAKTDPDFAKKAPLIHDRVQVLIGQMKPQTAEDAAKIVKQAHKDVTEYLRGLSPRNTITPGPSSVDGGKNNASTAKEPTSMLEAIQQSVANME